MSVHVLVALGDEAHRDPADHRVQRNTGVHQRERRPHTDAIDVDPLDSRTSDTTRIAYGNSSSLGSDGEHRLLRERAVADLATTRAAHRVGLTGRERREVVVVHVALRLVAQLVDADELLHARHRERRDGQRPASRHAGTAPVPCARESSPTSASSCTELLEPPSVDPLAVFEHHAAHDLLLQRTQRRLDLLARAPLELRRELLDDLGARSRRARCCARPCRRSPARRASGSSAIVFTRSMTSALVVARLDPRALAGSRPARPATLEIAELADDRLGGFQTVGDTSSVGCGRAVGDQLVACARSRRPRS